MSKAERTFGYVEDEISEDMKRYVVITRNKNELHWTLRYDTVSYIIAYIVLKIYKNKYDYVEIREDRKFI